MPSRIIRTELDLTQTYGLEEELQELVRVLEAAGVPDADSLLYTGIDGSKKRIQELLKNGIAGREATTFAMTIEEMIEGSDTAHATPLEYATASEKPAIAAYNPALLQSNPNDWGVYEIKKGHTFRDALIAIVTMNKPRN